MAKKIKYYFIKRSITWLTIVSVILFTSGLGLVFDFDIIKAPEKLASFILPEAQAQNDIATTTVEVRNAPPEITGGPAENPVSNANNPINVGSGISFSVTATDGELNSYQLVICSTDAITPDASGGDSHACDDATMATSTFVASGNVATARYNVVDPGAESDAWYAFVCDNHATQADCSSPGDQGVGDSGSPFYVNHAPSFTAIATTDNNKDPGEAYTITANVTDDDTEGANDQIELYVCGTDSWATSTGCAGDEYCYATSTSPNIICDTFATGSIAIDGDWDYYAFVVDWHDMPASQNSRSSTYHVNNVSPQVSNVIVNGNANITLNDKNMAEVLATTSAQLSDNNGCTDIVGATSTLYWSNAVNGSGCSADDNDCYHIASTFCTLDASSCTGSSDPNVNVVCSTTLAYHAIPTDISSGNPYSGTNWLAAVGTYDEALSSSTGSVGGVEVYTLTSLDVSEDTIPYGVIRGGENTGAYNATTTVINLGNAPLDSGIDVADMDDSPPVNVIEAENQYFATSTFTYGSGYTFAVEEASSTLQLDIAADRPLSAANVTAPVYWGIAIPAGKPSGTYTGMNTFSAILDGDGW